MSLSEASGLLPSVVGLLFCMALALDFRNTATWIRTNAIRNADGRPRWARGNVDAPVAWLRGVGAIGVVFFVFSLVSVVANWQG